MEYSIKPSENRDYIYIKVLSDFTAKEMMGCVLESHAMGMEMGIHNYLVDATEARNIDTAMGNYQFAYSDMKATEGIDRRARVASLVSPDDRSHDFVETVSENAGMNLKVFTDFDAAVNFLLQKYN